MFEIQRVNLKLQLVMNGDISTWVVIVLMPDIIITLKIGRAAVSASGVHLAAVTLCVCDGISQ